VQAFQDAEDPKKRRGRRGDAHLRGNEFRTLHLHLIIIAYPGSEPFLDQNQYLKQVIL